MARVVHLPDAFLVHDPLVAPPAPHPDRIGEVGRRRTVSVESSNISALKNTSTHGQVDLVDARADDVHRVQIQHEPRHPLVKRVLETIEFALCDRAGRSIRITWIEVMTWLRPREGQNRQLEWPAMVITLFCMIVPFISDRPKKSRVGGRQAKTSGLRLSGSGVVDMSSWNGMLDGEYGKGRATPAWCMSPGWQWVDFETDVSRSSTTRQTSRSKGSGKSQGALGAKETTSISQCISWSREFMQTAIGEKMIGTRGCLPTSLSKDPDNRRTAIGCVLVALHLLREEHKLDVRRSRSYDDEVQLLPVLAQIGHWLKWPSWGASGGCYYSAEMTDAGQQLLDDNTIISLDTFPQPLVPPSIFEFVEASLSNAKVQPFPTLLDAIGNHGSEGQQTMRARAELLTPRTAAVLKFFNRFASLQSWQAVVECMCSCGVNGEMLATMPTGIAAPFYEAISHCEGIEPSSWSARLLRLVGREDGKMLSKFSSSDWKTSKHHAILSHDSVRDYHGIGNLVLDTEPSHSWDASSEADRQGVTRLIFRDDRRFQDASRLVNQLRAPVVECYPEPDWTEVDLLEAQKEIVQLVAMRTLTVASGRGMMNYNSRVPLLTEKVAVPAFTLQCQIRPSNVTSSADRAAFTEDRAVWAFFHNGTAAGLTISRDARGIDTSWILYNKPPEPTNRHAGFLLALGLSGHLKSLAKWVAFKYLTPKHTMTSIGLLLGLSVSHLGTMDALITRLLSVHVTRMLPPGAAELNVSSLTQTAGIMGIGLLYCSSQHRRMSEVMLSEIENNNVEEGVPAEQTLRGEGYRLAAGFALGFMNLGQGKRLHALRDMNMMSRLLSMAISTKNVNLVHVLDRATSGATVAFALIYLKTNDAALANQIDIPDTIHQFGYVRPDVFLLRTVARHLIMWDSITPTVDFIRASLPKAYRHRVSLSTTRTLTSEDMAFFNILAGLCLALGFRFAGSGSHPVRDLLTSYLDHFIRLTRLPALNYDSKLTRNAVRNCQDVTALSLAAVMSGTGDIVVFRRLRSLHGRVDPDTPYGSHLAAHMAIGVLFLGGGTYTLGTGNLAVASLLCAFYPVFPTSVADNHAHLQAFRHLWVLAAEARCVVPRDVGSGKPISVPISIVMKKEKGEEEKSGLSRAGTAIVAPTKEDRERRLTAPCLIPNLDEIEEIRTRARGYWDVRISFIDIKDGAGDGEKRRAEFQKGHLNIFLRRRTTYDAPKGSVFVSELQALAEQGRAPSVAGLSASVSAPPGGLASFTGGLASFTGGLASFTGGGGIAGAGGGGGGGGGGGAGGGAGGDHSPFEWLWQLPILQDLDVRERALVLPPAPYQHHAFNNVTASGNITNGDEDEARAGLSTNYLRGTVVDIRLELEYGVLNDDHHHHHRHLLHSRNQNQKGSTGGRRRAKRRQGNRNLAMHQRDSLWQLRLLFAWTDATDRRDQQPEQPGQRLGMQTGDDDGDDGDTGGTWLRREVVERLRWRVWKMRMGIDDDDDDGDDGNGDDSDGDRL